MVESFWDRGQNDSIRSRPRLLAYLPSLSSTRSYLNPTFSDGADQDFSYIGPWTPLGRPQARQPPTRRPPASSRRPLYLSIGNTMLSGTKTRSRYFKCGKSPCGHGSTHPLFLMHRKSLKGAVFCGERTRVGRASDWEAEGSRFDSWCAQTQTDRFCPTLDLAILTGFGTEK